MGFFRKMFRREKRSEAITASDWLTGASSTTTVGVTEAMNIPAVSAAIAFISGIISTVPIKLYQRDGADVKEVAGDRRVKLLNDETGDLLDSVQMKEAMIRDYLLKGGGYAYLNKKKNEIVSVHYVKSTAVSAIVNSDPVFKRADFSINGQSYLDFNIMRLLRKTDDGARGVGILTENALILGTMYNALKYENITSGSGARKGFLKSAARLEEDALRQLKIAWKKLTSNDSNEAMVLNQGISFEPAASTAVESQFNENKKTNSNLIFNIFGLSSDVYGNDDVFLQGLKTGVMPIITAFTKTINRFMLLESEKDSYFFSFDLTDLMKAATLQRYQAYEIAIKNGWLTIDEVRSSENLESLELDFIKLGLDSVIYYYNDKKIYIPNTKEFVDVKGGGKVEN